MRWQTILAAAACLALGSAISAQSASPAVIVNKDEAKWTHDRNDPPGSESVFLREDPATGALELLVSYPAGHVFAPHWHDSNERILLIEGRLSLGEKSIGPGGYAFLPAKAVQ